VHILHPGVGIPWISLDSLVRIETFQWVTRESRGKFLPPAFVVGKQASKQLAQESACGGTNCSWGKPNLVSAFLQDIAARSRSFWPLPSKSDSP
jgi:hypothetical protein